MNPNESTLFVQSMTSKDCMKIDTWKTENNPCREVVFTFEDGDKCISIMINTRQDILRVINTLKKALPPIEKFRSKSRDEFEGRAYNDRSESKTRNN